MRASNFSVVLIALSFFVNGCYGAAATQAPASPQVSGFPQQLLGRVWLVEGPEGWVVGEVGGPRAALGPTEVGVGAAGGWIASADYQVPGATKLLLRQGAEGKPTILDVGDLAPTMVAFFGSSGYVTGVIYDTFTDPGILLVDLASGSVGALLPESDTKGARSLVVSADGSTMVTSLCDPTGKSPCSLNVLDIATGSNRRLEAGVTGVPLGTSSSVVVIAPQSDEALTWIAGVDLASGKEFMAS